MKEKLIIKNFGPIKSVELEIKKLTVLIGEQGTGKSAIARLLYLFSNSQFLFGNKDERENTIEKYGFFFKKNTQIDYTSEDYNIIYSKGLFSVEFLGRNRKTLERFSRVYKEFILKYNLNVQDEFYSLKDWLTENTVINLYIPAERIVIASMDTMMFNMGKFDRFTLDFYTNYSDAGRSFQKLSIPHLKKVEYLRKDNYDKVIFNGEELFLTQTSSGFQTSIPLIVVVESFEKSKDKIRFIIEEPESNLYPKAQYELIKYLIDKSSDAKNALFVTTHSPYVLTSLNNLLQAHIIGGKKGKSKKVSDLINKKNWVNPEDVSAYMLLPNGKFEDIFDRKLSMIKAERIDEVSSQINNEYDRISEINYGK